MAKPILVMQMQRMGDLILSFPLFLWLERQFPGREIWVLAEKSFFEPLMPISPRVTYFPWEGTDFLLRHEFELVLNLSIRKEAAALAGKVTAEEKLGPVQTDDGTYIRGPWQLYRASLVKNNRYNRFHWADLNALDVIPLSRISRTRYEAPIKKVETHPQVGLFLGASDPAKRPSAQFWANLCAQLVDRGIKPALFGGPKEKELGAEVMRIFGRPTANFCGCFGLDQISRAMHRLALFVSPDTGPMHLAVWNGCPTLNLSMGNVSPWETGPYTPGHTVLRADIACAPGCWECTRSRLYCHDPIEGSLATPVAAFITRAAKGRIPGNPPPSLTLARSSRDNTGLFDLTFFGSAPLDAASKFWQAFFGYRLGLWEDAQAMTAAAGLAENAPEAAEHLIAQIPGLLGAIRSGLRSRTLPELWPHSDDIIRPFTGWADLVLENENGSPEGFKTVLKSAQALQGLLV